jgi:hypothetical protein
LQNLHAWCSIPLYSTSHLNTEQEAIRDARNKIRAHQAITYDLKIYPSYNPLSGHKIILLSMEGMKGVKAGKDE